MQQQITKRILQVEDIPEVYADPNRFFLQTGFTGSPIHIQYEHLHGFGELKRHMDGKILSRPPHKTPDFMIFDHFIGFETSLKGSEFVLNNHAQLLKDNPDAGIAIFSDYGGLEEKYGSELAKINVHIFHKEEPILLMLYAAQYLIAGKPLVYEDWLKESGLKTIPLDENNEKMQKIMLEYIKPGSLYNLTPEQFIQSHYDEFIRQLGPLREGNPLRKR